MSKREPIVDERIRKLVDCIFDTHADNTIDCETCASQFHGLADLVAAGASVGQILPAVQEHLDCCPECFEEFQALISMIVMENSATSNTDHQ